MPSILLTRPQAASENLAAALRSLGYGVAIEPLLEITPVFPPRPAAVPDDASFDAVMITSSNALEALAAGRREVEDILGTPCFCVGPRTAERARAFGFRDVRSATNDGAELARLVGAAAGGRNARVLHIAGQDVDGKAQEELQAMGCRVAGWPVYAAAPAASLTQAACGLFRERKLDAVLVFSPRTAATLAALLEEKALGACCESLAAICLSGVVADALKQLTFRHLVTAPVPTEDAVIACLQKTCPVNA